MTFLGVEKKRPGYKLVGASLPLAIHNYLTLYTLSKGISKTKILKNLIEDWIIIHQKKETEEDLLKKIIYRVNAQWKIEKGRRRNKKQFEQFISDLKEELVEKGLTDDFVKSIIIGIER
jgi:DNA-binding PadR family transcriptional regulator